MNFVKIHRDFDPSDYACSSENITAAFKKAIEDALAEKKRLGIPIAIWEDGKVVKISPDKI